MRANSPDTMNEGAARSPLLLRGATGAVCRSRSPWARRPSFARRTPDREPRSTCFWPTLATQTRSDAYVRDFPALLDGDLGDCRSTGYWYGRGQGVLVGDGRVSFRDVRSKAPGRASSRQCDAEVLAQFPVRAARNADGGTGLKSPIRLPVISAVCYRQMRRGFVK
jgi:hypothetical protein